VSPSPPGDWLASVLIVNYNGRHHLDACLRALAAQDLPRHRFEVIVADNGSSDGSVEFLREHFPWARTVAFGENLGFAEGNNRALEYAHGDLIALLNNDTRPHPGWLGELVRVLLADPTTGGVASKLVLRDEPGVLNSAGLLLLRDGRGADRGFRRPDRGQYDRTEEVFGACGASVLLRRSMIDDVGLFDRRFFMYYEDLDLAWRGRLRGWRFLFAPRSVVQHAHCATAGEWSPFFAFHVERNRVLTSLKNAAFFPAFWAVVGGGLRVARAWLRLAGRRPPGLTARHGWSLTRALVSVFRLLPGVLCDRYRIRVARRKVPDGAVNRWVRRAA
jgi:GT2 family glycosyltransferase